MLDRRAPPRVGGASPDEVPVVVLELERLVARHPIQLPRSEVLRLARRGIARATAALSLVLAVLVGIAAAMTWMGFVPGSAAPWLTGIAAAMTLIPVLSRRAALRELGRWPLDRSLSFVSPASGLVLLGATRCFCRGQFRGYLPGTLVENPAGHPGIGELDHSRGPSRRQHEVFLFDLPPSMPAAARAAITSFLVRAPASGPVRARAHVRRGTRPGPGA